MRASEDLLEGPNGLLEGYELALETGEDLRDLEGLRHETLDLTSALDLNADAISLECGRRFSTLTYSELILLRQLVHTQDSNDILEGLVVLKDLLDSGGDVVVFLTDLIGQTLTT